MTILELITNINKQINTFLWDKLGLVLLILTGIIFTFATQFFQLKHLFFWISQPLRNIKKRQTDNTRSGITQMQALCTSLASTIGVGSVVGVSAAIKSGGCGAVFWMWTAAFFSMMTAYAENVLSIYFREKNKDGIWQGGTMYVLKNAAKTKKHFRILFKILAVLFCIFCILASFGIGNLGQINKITENLIYSFPVSQLSDRTFFNIPIYNLIIAFVLTFLCGFIITGGLKRVAKFAERVVPLMVLFFVSGSLVVIFYHRENITFAINSIFTEAFSVKAAVGAANGITLKHIITTGCKRGLFSTEAGMGSTTLINSSSNVKEPAEQGMWGIFQVFVDTFLICTMTALVILTSKVSWNLSDSVMVADAFATVFGAWGNKFVAISILMFALTSTIGWSQYASVAVEYLKIPLLNIIYKALFIATIPLGCIITSELTWSICDTFNALMMIPNLIALICLFPTVIKIHNNYCNRTFKHKNITPMLSFDKHIQAKHQMALKREKE